MRRVLVVHSDRTVRRLAQVTLGRAGWDVLVATNEHDALESAKSRHPDAIALDETTEEGAAARESLSECIETRSIPVFQIPPRPW